MKQDAVFHDALQGLRRGDFSRLEPLFESPAQIVAWVEQGHFDNEPEALAEALSCACFNGKVEVAEYLLDRGVDPMAGAGTGMNAFHWAANRGQLEAVRLLIRRKAPLEVPAHGGAVLGTAVWSAINEPKPDHLQIIEELIRAGARIEEAGYPTGNDRVDALLQRLGAK